MKALFRIGLVCGVIAIAALAAVNHVASAKTAKAACTAGTRYDGTIRYTTWCGPARVSLKVGPTTYLMKGGNCALEHNGPFKWVIHVGTSTYGGKPKYNYVQLDVKSDQPGTSNRAGLTYQVKATGHYGNLANAVVTLNAGLKSGTFKGKGKENGGGGWKPRKRNISGSFHC